MSKLIIMAIVLAVVAAGLGVAGDVGIPVLIPQAFFALALIILLLNVMNESDGKRG